MRDIKFRGYSKSFKKMLSNEMLEMAAAEMVDMCNEKLKILVPESTEIQMGLFLPTYDKDLILMQYTGLKDGNGKEIYEGDVVKIEFDIFMNFGLNENIKEHWNQYYFVGKVAFNDGSWLVENGEEGYFLFQELKCIYVLGNIYENPELLK